MAVKRFTDNMEAYNLYLKARHELYRMTRDSVALAQTLFRGAIDLDPGYALAHEGLAYALFTEAILGFAAPQEAMPSAREAVLRALEIDDTVAEAHATFGLILAVYDWDWAGAEREFRRSIALNESSPLSRDNYAFYYLRPVKRLAEARVQTQQALALDPLAVLTRVHLGFLFYAEKQFEQAAAQFQKALELDAGPLPDQRPARNDAGARPQFRGRLRSPPARARGRPGQQIRGLAVCHDPGAGRPPR